MLRTLLEDRFRLAVHHETKDMPGYALLMAKGGFTLKPVEASGSSGTSRNGGRVQTLTAKKSSMAALADDIARSLGEMVVDKTGIEGVYDFELRFTTDDLNSIAPDADTVPSLFTALKETLGLRLQPEKVPVDIIVVTSSPGSTLSGSATTRRTRMSRHTATATFTSRMGAMENSRETRM